jgi:hypothetical protein
LNQEEKKQLFPCQLEIVICHGLREVQYIDRIHHLLAMETLVYLLHLRRFDKNGLSSPLHVQKKRTVVFKCFGGCLNKGKCV